MIWLIFRLAILAVVMAAPHERTHQGELSILVGYLLFDLLWLLQRKLPAYRTAACLVFSMLLGATSMLLLIGGSLVSIAFCWPSLMLRLEDRPLAEQRLALVAVQILLAVLVPDTDFPLLYLRFGPIFLSLIQLPGGRPATWANSAAIAWLLGPLVQAWLFPGGLDPAALARTALLMLLPQLGLRALHKRG